MSELQTFDYDHDGTALKGVLATPRGAGPHPGVLVMHNAHGLGEQVRQRAALLAEAGYVALATDMYGGGRFFERAADAGEPYAALQNDPQRLRARVVAAFETFRALPQVDAARIGAVGFCFGGQCVLELARSGADLGAVVSLHGTLSTREPARAGAVKAKILVITGARDPYAPAEDVAAFRDEMAAAGANWQLTVYGEGWHAFSDPSARQSDNPGLRYDPLLDTLSWAQTLSLLDAAVRGSRLGG